MGGRILCKDNIDIVFMTDAAREKTQHSGMLLLCFKSLCERLSGQLCVDATSLGYTHKASTGPPNGCSHIDVTVSVTSKPQQGVKKHVSIFKQITVTDLEVRNLGKQVHTLARSNTQS